MLVALALTPTDGVPGVRLLAVGIGLVMVALVGWIDDHRPLSPWIRLATHVLAAACLGIGLLVSGAGLPVAIGGAVLALILTNVWNFMDGIDGLAASQALLVAAGCLLLAGPVAAAWLPLSLIAACAGFLPFNLPPARIFLGDVGSGALGYLLAALVALQATRDAASALLLLLPLSAFMVDATLTLARRVVRGERWWLPHTQHAYQQWAGRCGRHGIVTLAYAVWTAVMLLNLSWASGSSTFVRLLALPGCYLAGAITWMWLQRTPHPPGDRE
jgi:UDP-N-acetylmuramyl pentapeptide phosphotransferase/UDP-N-acetylglucosamine-1-phosphate transferase